jgi:hypothetical protein
MYFYRCRNEWDINEYSDFTNDHPILSKVCIGAKVCAGVAQTSALLAQFSVLSKLNLHARCCGLLEALVLVMRM